MPTIDELKAALKVAEQAAEAKACGALDAIPFKREWRVEWTSEHVLNVAYRANEKTQKAFAAWCASFPRASYPSKWADAERWNGMTYVLVEPFLVQCGGGALVLEATANAKDHFCHEPRRLTDDECAALRAGNVPESVKAKWCRDD